MRRILSILCLILLFIPALYAQNADTTVAATPPDDMPFALILAIALFSLAAGCAIIGTLAAIIALVVIGGFISAGILSTSILVGLYRKSATAAFRTLTITTSIFAGIITGVVGLFLVNRFFHLHLARVTWALTGILGGAIGGLLLAFSVLFILKVFIHYFKKRLGLQTASN